MAIAETLKVHVQPQGKKNKVFQAIVPSANGILVDCGLEP